MQNKIAKLKEELAKLEIEQKHFANNFKENYIPVSKFSFYRKWSSDLILDFITYFEKIALTNRSNSFIVKTFLFIKYGIYKFKYLNKNQNCIIVSLKKDYYKSAIAEKKWQISSFEMKLERKSYKKLMEQYADVSKKLFKASLYRKYSQRARGNYTIRNFKYKFPH